MIAYLGSARQNGTNVSSFDMTNNVSEGSNLLVAVLHQRGATLRDITAITYNGVSLTRAGSTSDRNMGGAWLRDEIWYLANPSTGSNTLSVTYSGTGVGYEAQVSWYSGADTADVYVGANTANGNDNVPAVSLDPGSVDDCLLVAGVIHEAATVLTTDGGEETLFNFDNGAYVTSSSYAIQTTAASQSMNWSAPTADHWAAVGAIFRADTNSPPDIVLNTADEATLSSTPTLEFTGTDPDSEDIRYQIQISDNPNFLGGVQLADHHDTGSGAGLHPNGTGTLTWQGENQVDDRFGQSFEGGGGILYSVQYYFDSDEVETTDGYALGRIYDHQGTFGTSSEPLNPADPADTPTPGWLAESDSRYFDGVIAGTTETWQEFLFTGSDRIRLEAGQPYVTIADWIPNSGVYANTIKFSGDAIVKDHPGNAYIDGSSVANNGIRSDFDLHFKIFEEYVLLDKVSGTDSGFANTEDGGDTDPFTSGEKVSFTVQSGDELEAGITYYWRVRASDPSGTNQWSSWSAVRSFTVEAASGDNEGSLSKSIGAFTLVSDGTVDVDGAASLQIGAFQLSSAGDVESEEVSGVLSGSVAPFSILSDGTVDVQGALAQSVAPFSLASDGNVPVDGELSGNLAPLGLSAEGSVGNVPVEGVLSGSLGSLSLVSSGTVDVVGVASVNVASLQVSADGDVSIVGQLSKSLAPFTLSASSASEGGPISDVLGASLGSFGLSSVGQVLVSGIGNLVLGRLILSTGFASGPEIVVMNAETAFVLEMDAETAITHEKKAETAFEFARKVKTL